MKPRSVFLETINKIDEPLEANEEKKKRRTQMNKIRTERKEITVNITDIQKNHKRMLCSYMPTNWTMKKK